MTSWRLVEDEVDFQNIFDLKEIPLHRQENRHPSYCISWSKRIRSLRTTGQKYQIFCCCGGDKAVIVGVENNNNNKSWHKFSTFIDDDPNESYRACTFGGKSSSSGAEFLILGGAMGVIRLVDIEQRCVVDSLTGHEPGMVNDLKISPTNESFLLSASTDESIRLWNLTVRTCVAVFAGRNGHRRAVLSVSWDINGIRFASSGIDGCIRLWDVMCDQEVVEAIHARSGSWPELTNSNVGGGKPYNAEMPYFRSNALHDSAVDEVHWLSDETLLSKSRDNNEILLWAPDFSKTNEQRQQVRLLAYPATRDVIVLRKFQLSGEQNYFSRFGVDSLGQQLVVGEQGSILTWNLDEDANDQEDTTLPDSHMESGDDPVHTLKTSNPDQRIRVASLAPDGRVLVACSDDGSLYRWSAI